MKNIVLVSVAIGIILLGIIYSYVGGIMGDDAVNALSMLAAVLIIFIGVGVSLKYVNQMKNDRASGELADENWDGIGEYKNPLPVGWALSFLGTLLFAFWYWIVGYPVNAYSQIGEYNEEVASYNAKFQATHANADTDTLNKMGKNLFLVQCAPCHGVAGDGLDGKAADFTKWGNEAGIVDAVVNGSKGLGYAMGAMPGGMLDADSAKAVAAYVMAEVSTVGKTAHPELVEAGRSLFVTCAGCHGADGKGQYGTAPDLSKYGTAEFVVDVLQSGKNGHIGNMPSFKVEENRLTPVQQKAVGTYVSTLAAE
jgi:cytochrome c oxidase cbb3-type subunit 3